MRSSLRRIATAGGSLRQPSQPPCFVCCRCRLEAPSVYSVRTSVSRIPSRNASSSEEKRPFGENIRRKLWGTDEPPGQDDPYTSLSPEEKQAEQQRRLQKATTAKSLQEDPTKATEPQKYIAATTWDGLERIGGATGWWEEAWDRENQFEGFIPATKIDPAAVEDILQRAVQETCKLEDAERWREVQLDEESKFPLIKRVMQLSGARIPDPVIRTITCPGDILNHLMEKPKPKKLAEILFSKPELASLPNVQIFDRRHTPIDKEKEVGRWKLIEEELERRNLPVTGNV